MILDLLFALLSLFDCCLIVGALVVLLLCSVFARGLTGMYLEVN